MTYIKPYEGVINEPGWIRMGQTDKMKKGDVMVFCKPGPIGYYYLPPDEVKGHTWDGKDGLIVTGWHGTAVSFLSKVPASETRKGWQYAVLRNPSKYTIKRKYKPSRWADPLPLP